MVAADSSDDGEPRVDPDPPAEAPTYVVNVDVAVSRVPSDESPEPTTEVQNRVTAVRNRATAPRTSSPVSRPRENETHAPGTLGFPGGTVEVPPGEAGVVESTARREGREEVGVDVADPERGTSTTFESDGGERMLNLLVAADDAGGEAHPTAPDEVAAVEWRTAESVLADDETPPWTCEQVRAVRR